jgi:1-acyl-sn-glycerol-3-phosphate acyltransferase
MTAPWPEPPTARGLTRANPSDSPISRAPLAAPGVAPTQADSPLDPDTERARGELPPRDADWAPAPRTDRIYGVIQAWARTLLGCFYRVEVLGARFPQDGPLVVCSNHSNGLADAGVMFHATDRPLRPLAKQPLFEMPVIGRLVRWAGAVAIHRRQDGADTAKNAAAFDAVGAALGRSEAILIFPEGTSGFEPKLQRFRSGTARLAVQGDLLQDDAGHPASRGVRIVPLGLVYADRDRYGTPAYAWVGRSFHTREVWNGTSYDIDRLTERVRTELARVCVEARDWPRLRLARFAAELLPPDEHSEPERWQMLCDDWERMEQDDPEAWIGLREELEGLESEVRRTVREPLARRVGRWVAQAAWGLPAWACRRIGHSGRPSPDKLVTVQLLAATVLMPTWALLVAGLSGLWAGWIGAAAAGAVLALGALLAPRCASAYRALPAGPIAEDLGRRLAAGLRERGAAPRTAN